MGMKKLKEIMEVFSSFDKGNTPVAIIQDGSREDEKIGLGAVSTIVDVAKEQGLSSPAIIVVGEIVKYTRKDRYTDLISDYLHTPIE